MRGGMRAARAGAVSFGMCAAVGALLLLGGCAGKERVLQALDVAPHAPRVAKGLSQQLLATAIYTDGTTADVTGEVVWESSNPAIVKLSDTPGALGTAVTVNEGAADVSARLQGQSAAVTITVTPAELAAIEVSPSTPAIPVLATKAFVATGIYTDGSKQDVTPQATWTSSDPSILDVSDQSPTKGLATAKAAGSATVRATLGTRSAGTLVTVNPLQLKSLEFGIATLSLPLGTTQRLVLTGIFEDNSRQDLSESAVWSSSDPQVATISDLPGSKGQVQTVAQGTATVRAAFAGQKAEVQVTVTPASLDYLDVRPKSTTLVVGTTQQYTATGVYSDGSKQLLTSQVTWSVGDTSVGTVSNDAGTQGLVSAKAAGSTKVIAVIGSVRASTGLTVTSSQLASITPSVRTLSLPAGTKQQVRATGGFSDGSQQDVTEQVVWASSDASVLSVSNAPGESGTVTALQVGSSTLTATLNGVVASVPVTVTEATLSSLEITAPSASLAKGTTLQLVATGIYSDDSRRVLTSQVTWSSADAGIATVSNSAGSEGLVTARQTGTALIGAAFGGASGSIQLAVTDAPLTGIRVTPQPAQVVAGLTVQLVVRGTFADGSEQDLTSGVVWASADESIAEVSNDPATSGLVTGVTDGQTTITAQFGGFQATVEVDVSPAQLLGLTLTPGDTTAQVGASVTFAAAGRYTDGSTRTVTDLVAWSSSDTGVATVTGGVVQAVGAGQATIRAELEGKVQTATLTVNAP